MPVDVEEMVRMLPRQLEDDQAFNVCIKKRLIHKSNYLSGYVKKSVVKAWLRYLINTPLYRSQGIVLDEDLLGPDVPEGTNEEDMVELEFMEMETEDGLQIPQQDDHIELDVIDTEAELFTGQQQTVLWNEDMSLCIAPGQHKTPLSIVYDQFSEELSFPGIYLGQMRVFRKGVRVTPYDRATSEIRRRDRRGATPTHILYMATKIMRLRVHDGCTNTFRVQGTSNVTRAQLIDPNFMHGLMERNLTWVKSIPNSALYWQMREKDLFAMIRQLGKPTVFLTMSANETNWPDLLKTLYELSDQDTRIE